MACKTIGISIPKELHEFMKAEHISASRLMQQTLRARMLEKENSKKPEQENA